VLALEDAAWQRVVHLYQPLLYGRCRRKGLSPDDAADVVQEVILAAFKSVDGFRHEPKSSFRAWLLGIAANKLKDHWERKGRNPQAEGGSDAGRRLAEVPGVDDSSKDRDDAAEKAGLLRRALELLQQDFEERTWKAFWRFDVDQRTAAEIAAEIGMTPNAVHVAACRVRKRLREEFSDLL
jgi:RNA polymerase sigma-70 factor (ECF subfamily)